MRLRTRAGVGISSRLQLRLRLQTKHSTPTGLNFGLDSDRPQLRPRLRLRSSDPKYCSKQKYLGPPISRVIFIYAYLGRQQCKYLSRVQFWHCGSFKADRLTLQPSIFSLEPTPITQSPDSATAKLDCSKMAALRPASDRKCAPPSGAARTLTTGVMRHGRATCYSGPLPSNENWTFFGHFNF